MIAITQEHISFIIGLITIAGAIKGVFVGIDKKLEKNNEVLLKLIDEKLDTKIYEKEQEHFKEWSNKRDEVLNERISKLEKDIKDDLNEIKGSLKIINEHMLNCNKRGVG
ncbi:MAG: hypothetical protein SPJ84_06445 [Fusobacterium gastrosuis]|uniref:hypothetical protein n=1 Tax=Fusobacterium gastrosuis TaxID=1755100 RepID=UPI002A94AE4E|nr:hypothetical protein [Fusobacteriaceae bacterium]MDY5795447.1 hypothetical protein [Fusobacterium gastrosuis]